MKRWLGRVVGRGGLHSVLSLCPAGRCCRRSSEHSRRVADQRRQTAARPPAAVETGSGTVRALSRQIKLETSSLSGMCERHSPLSSSRKIYPPRKTMMKIAGSARRDNCLLLTRRAIE
jgi:hypothetical protein